MLRYLHLRVIRWLHTTFGTCRNSEGRWYDGKYRCDICGKPIPEDRR